MKLKKMWPIIILAVVIITITLIVPDKTESEGHITAGVIADIEKTNHVPQIRADKQYKLSAGASKEITPEIAPVQLEEVNENDENRQNTEEERTEAHENARNVEESVNVEEATGGQQDEAIEEPQEEPTKETSQGSSAGHLTKRGGVFYGPSGKETYYNLPMKTVCKYMRELGYDYEYSVREDGVKLYGGYVMVAADLSIRPKGTIIETSLGTGIVCDTGDFVNSGNPNWIDIAVNW